MHVFSNEHAAVSLLTVVHGFRCSWHSHDKRVNAFHVVTGCIVIEEYLDSGKIRKTKLTSGRSHIVASKIVHRFRVLESGNVVEVYYPQSADDVVCLDDIHRVDVGGPDVVDKDHPNWMEIE